MKIKIFLILISIITSLLCAGPIFAQNNAECRWINSEPSDSTACQRYFGNSKQKWANSGDCDLKTKGKFDIGCCCPVKTPRNYTIIGWIAAVLGVITVISFAIKKHEDS